VWKQFRRWCEAGIWDLLLQALADGGGALDLLQMIDSTIVRAHRCAAGEKTEGQNQALGRSRGEFGTRSMCVATPQVSPSGSCSARVRPMT
jgi:transposase